MKIFLLALIFLSTVGYNVTARVSDSSESRRVAVFYALDADAEVLEESMKFETRVEGPSGPFRLYSFEDMQVAIIRMEPGPVNSAINTVNMLSRFSPDLVVSIGVAGALNPLLSPGDFELVGEVVPYQVGSWQSTGFEVSDSVFDAATPTYLREAIEEAFGISSIQPHRRVASGEAFIASTSQNERMHASTEADLVEMNLFGLCSVNSTLKIPSIHIRVVSDSAGDQASSDFREFVEGYNGLLGESLIDLLRNLPDDPESPFSYPGLRGLLENSGGSE